MSDILIGVGVGLILGAYYPAFAEKVRDYSVALKDKIISFFKGVKNG